MPAKMTRLELWEAARTAANPELQSKLTALFDARFGKDGSVRVVDAATFHNEAKTDTADDIQAIAG